MKLQEVRKLAEDLITQHKLYEPWSFKFDSSKRRFGVCKYITRTISMSRALSQLNEEPAVKDVILHEIAHALVGLGHHHDSKWRKVAIEIGCNGERCYDDSVIQPKGNWIGTCPNGHTSERHRRLRGRIQSCGICSPGVFKHELAISWKRR